MDNYSNVGVPKMGVVTVLATDAKHIFVSTADHGPITVNGVKYYLSAHIYLWDDGEWHWGPSRDMAWREPYMRRVEATGNRSYDPSCPAREKVRVEVLMAVLGWIKENPAAIADAEMEDLKKALQTRLREKEELTAKMAEILDKISALRGKIAEKEAFKLVSKAG